jgi:hypothetical protein
MYSDYKYISPVYMYNVVIINMTRTDIRFYRKLNRIRLNYEKIDYNIHKKYISNTILYLAKLKIMI